MTSLQLGQDVYTASFHTGEARLIGKIVSIRDGVTRATDNGPIYDDRSNIEVELNDGGRRWFPRTEIFNYDHVVWIGFRIV